MQLADVPMDLALGRLALVCRITPKEREWAGSMATSTVLWQESVDIKNARYPLRQPLQGYFFWSLRGWALRLGGLSPTFVGEGHTQPEAEASLKNQVHAAFQDLYGKRPFQMEAEELAQWAVLQAAIDVAAYIRETPVQAREIGMVDWFERMPLGRGYEVLRVRWLNGRTEMVPFDLAPVEFAGFRPDVWFEAVVKREPGTRRLLGITSVSRIQPVKRMSAEQGAAYWDGLPTTKSLPSEEAGA